MKQSSSPIIEFVSSLSLSECVSRIKALDDRKGCLALQPIRVNIVPDGDQRYWFHIRNGVSFNRVAEAKGDLTLQDTYTTIVRVEANTPLSLRAPFLIMILFGLLLLLGVLSSGDYGGVLFIVVWLGIAALNLYRINRWRDELLLLVQKSLS